MCFICAEDIMVAATLALPWYKVIWRKMCSLSMNRRKA